jgi:sugar phosphate isomerase/epimerase
MPDNRRTFIKNATAATTAALLSSLDVFALENKFAMPLQNGFSLKIMATKWGYAGTINEFCKKVKALGYDGIEVWWPKTKTDQDELLGSLKEYDLVAGYLCGDNDAAFANHFAAFKEYVANATANKVLPPLYINCHSGRDFFAYEENRQLIDFTTSVTSKTGMPIYHETHRSRMLFAAPVAKKYLQENPALKITFDVSHWCNVSESLLQDQPATLALAIERAEHIHARIGHAEGPQVNDPRAPEWDAAVKAHFAWWDKIVERKKERGEVLTILTEFGPPDYMPTTAYTRQPLADQWAINVHMMQLLRKRYL